MAKEIERKFLLKPGASIPIPEKHMKFDIKQGYIFVSKDQQMRVRLFKWGSETFANICVKYTGKLVRDEFEFPVNDTKEAKALYNKCRTMLEKKRLSFEIGKDHYDVDSFPNKMVFVEVEFKSVKDMKAWVKPSWLGKEITGQRKYSNIVLAKKKLKFK